MAELITAKHLLGLCAAPRLLGYFKSWSTIADPVRGLPHFHSLDLFFVIWSLAATAMLTVYGLHRGWLVCCYISNRRNAPRRPPDPSEWPTVTIQLPIYNERYVIERLVDAVAKFDYPRELLDIQVLDDSTDETQEVARACVERHRALGLPIYYLHRTNRIGFKAGALAAGLESAKGEFVALFDADFLPEPDFLRRTVPYFADRQVAMVQARWSYLNPDYSLLTKVESMMIDGYFGMDHLSRSRSGIFFHFTGTAGVWRRTAIDDAGGWEHDTLTEDIDLSYRAQLRGWRLLYLLDVICPSEVPVEMNAFKEQQARWAKGSTQVAKKILPKLFRSEVSARIKVEAFLNLTASVACPMMVVFAVLLLPGLLLHLNHFRYRTVLIDLPCVISSCAVAAFYLVSQYVIHPRTWWRRSILYLPALTAVGFAISLRVGKGVLEAILGIKSDFVRTSKFNIDGSSGSWHSKQYRNRAGWMPYLEIALAFYFGVTLVYSIQHRVYETAPFLLMCVAGFLYVGMMSLTQGWWERLRVGARRGAAVAPSAALPDEPGSAL
jgi:cellulose synthase/poly-beta-1,6-N-acetylglucosamine synthase-like glycosyltransferase